MSYVTKLGAYGLGAVTAFAVALALLASVSSTPTAEAQAAPDHTLGTGANNVDDVAPGDTVRIVVTGAFAQVSITGTADGVGGSFDANDGQSIACGNANSCDKDTDAATVSVDLTVDADSGEGHILLSVGGLGATTATKVINVNKSTLVGSLSLTAVSKTIAASDDTDTAGVTENQTSLVVNVKNAASAPLGLNDQSVTLLTTLGTISCDNGTNYAQACSVTTADSSSTPGVADDGVAGYGTVILRGGGVEGVATITATLGSLSKTVDVTMFGSAKNLTAEPQQGSVEIGGSVFVVLTVTDGAGNPVSGATVVPGTPKEITGPEGVDNPVLVATSKDATADDTADGSGYNVDYIHPTDSKKSLPACGDDKDPVTNAGATPPTTEDFTDNGTNDAGKCVVQVTTQKAAGSQKATTRGLHTLNFKVGTIKASATIEVAGAPSSITTDAPAQVASASVTDITVSVWDDTGVLVGITAVKVRKVDGGGLIEDEGDDGSEMTVNGQSKFTFIAPSGVGSSEILITAGDVDHRVTLQIGETVTIEEPPEDTTPTLAVAGNLGVFSGGSLADFEAAVAAACDGGALIWAQAGGQWFSYSTTAPAFVNSPFVSAFSLGFLENTPVWVSQCDGMGG